MISDALKKIYRLAGEAVVRFRMIAQGERILVALSGGKDSCVMLDVLVHLREVAPIDFEIVAATFDPGYPEFDAACAGKFCRRYGIEHHIVRCDVDAAIREKAWQDAPCVLCSRLRRGHLYKTARELSCGALSLGQHLDDAVTSFWMSLCRGQGVTSMAPVVPPQSAAAVRVIRPLILVPEAAIADAAAQLDLPDGGHCPFEEQLRGGDRHYFRSLIDTLAERIPDVRANILRSFAHIEPDHLAGGNVVHKEDENAL